MIITVPIAVLWAIFACCACPGDHSSSPAYLRNDSGSAVKIIVTGHTKALSVEPVFGPSKEVASYRKAMVFEDLYPWAGQSYTVQILSAKSGTILATKEISQPQVFDMLRNSHSITITYP